MKNQYDVIVIGGGAAGMMAAGRAGELGARVLLIEKNDRLGKKLSITGGRRCNITNAEFDNRLFLENFPESKQFLYSPFSKFNVESTFEFFESRGLKLKVEDRKRAFPQSDRAEDVCAVLENYIDESNNVSVLLNADFESFIIKDDVIAGVKTSAGTHTASRYILATGGLAAPETGSTGEWLPVLRKIGHTVKEPDPNLAPLKTSAKWVHSLSGTSVDDVGVRFLQAGKTKHKARGRILFTHFGVSGPIIINSAFAVKNLLKIAPVTALIDLFPDHDLGSLDRFFIDLFEQNKNKQFKSIVKELFPAKLLKIILYNNKLSIAETAAHSISKEDRKTFVHAVKELQFPITGTMGFEWAIIADGGVAPNEIDFRTMKSRIHQNLYLIGDTININRPSGGFSLQICWTTAYIAATEAANND